MRIDRIRFQNFRCFENRTFELASRFNLVIGDNGTGKTSFFNGLSSAIKIFFFELRAIHEVFTQDQNAVRTKTFWNDDKPNVEMQFPLLVECDGLVDEKTVAWAFRINRPRRSNRVGPDDWIAIGNLSPITENLHSRVTLNKRVILPVFGYYGAQRVWNQKKRSKDQAMPPGSRFLGYHNCLDPTSNLMPLLKWFKTRELVALQKNKKLNDLEAIRLAIRTCVADASDVFWDMETDQFAIRFDKEITWFKNLSDGYRNMLAMVADIAQRCVTLNPQMGADAIQQTPGIVLIDEIDLHLHPKWQQHVVGDLLRAFPKVQFVATTHSPFIIQALAPNEGCKLINLDKPDASDFANKSVEDITEEIQGVDDPPPQRSKRHQEMMKAAEEYYRVLKQIPQAPENQIVLLRNKLDDLMLPFSDDPAYQSFLRLQRAAAGVDGENGHASH